MAQRHEDVLRCGGPSELRTTPDTLNPDTLNNDAQLRAAISDSHLRGDAHSEQSNETASFSLDSSFSRFAAAA